MIDKGKKEFPRGIEVIEGLVIENKNSEIFLTKSPKWSNKWGIPGGHVEPGEKLIDAVIREGKEETGLDLEPVAVVSWGEMINSKDFHRPAHFVYFDVYCRITKGKLKLQKEELSEYKWITPQEALKLELAENCDTTLKDFITYKQQKKGHGKIGEINRKFNI